MFHHASCATKLQPKCRNGVISTWATYNSVPLTKRHNFHMIFIVLRAFFFLFLFSSTFPSYFYDFWFFCFSLFREERYNYAEKRKLRHIKWISITAGLFVSALRSNSNRLIQTQLVIKHTYCIQMLVSCRVKIIKDIIFLVI